MQRSCLNRTDMQTRSDTLNYTTNCHVNFLLKGRSHPLVELFRLARELVTLRQEDPG